MRDYEAAVDRTANSMAVLFARGGATLLTGSAAGRPCVTVVPYTPCQLKLRAHWLRALRFLPGWDGGATHVLFCDCDQGVLAPAAEAPAENGGDGGGGAPAARAGFAAAARDAGVGRAMRCCGSRTRATGWRSARALTSRRRSC